MQLPTAVVPIVERSRDGRVVVLTGAGTSAESNIPTFRGPEGYWTVGAQEYHPQEMATVAAFRAMPDEVGVGTCIASGFVAAQYRIVPTTPSCSWRRPSVTAST